MKILVTGNLGYVGPAVVRHLRETHPDASLCGFDTGFFAGCLTGATTLPERVLDCQLFGDVRDVPADTLAGVDAVVHLAAVSNDPIGNLYEGVTLDINHRATVELATKAKAMGARAFVYASSCSVYGAAGEGPRGEGAELAPLTAYARSKVLSERDLAELADDGFVVTSLRFATACGMSDRLRLDLVLNDFVASALATGSIVLLSDGSAWRPLIHVADMARAIEWAVLRDADAGAFLAVNTGADEWNYRIRDLAEFVAAEIRGADVRIQPRAAQDPRSYQVDFGLFRELAPDHRPRVTLAQAVRELRDGLQRMGFRDPEFRSSTLVRLRMLEALRAAGLLSDRLEWTDARASLGAVSQPQPAR